MINRLVALLLVLTPTSALGTDIVKVTRSRDGTKRFTFQKPVVVVGQRHRPMAAYVLGRTRPEYERKNMVRWRKMSMDQIVEAVRHKPF